jgi:hypothetical protein
VFLRRNKEVVKETFLKHFYQLTEFEAGIQELQNTVDAASHDNVKGFNPKISDAMMIKLRENLDEQTKLSNKITSRKLTKEESAKVARLVNTKIPDYITSICREAAREAAKVLDHSNQSS